MAVPPQPSPYRRRRMSLVPSRPQPAASFFGFSFWVLAFAVPLFLGLGLMAMGRLGLQKKPALAAPDLANARAEAPSNGAKAAPEEDRPRAPELEGGTGWLNTAGPIRLKDLRGKIVVLDFWTL